MPVRRRERTRKGITVDGDKSQEAEVEAKILAAQSKGRPLSDDLPPVLLPFSTILLSILLLFVVYHVQKEVSEPYMDEEFHYDQAEQYCIAMGHTDSESPMDSFSGKINKAFAVTHNPKVTTPPGLYYFVATENSVLNAVSSLFGAQGVTYECESILNMRMTLIPCAVGVYLVFAALFHLYDGEEGADVGVSHLLRAMQAALLPVGFFFYFLLYNETLSTVTVLIVHYLASRRRTLFAAIFAWLALCVRQTNLVWVVFAVSSSILSMPTTQEYLGKSKLQAGLLSPLLQVFYFVYFCFCRNIVPLIATWWPFLGVLYGAGTFFIENGGRIALGDHSAHEVAFHGPQFLYFLVFACGMLPVRSLVALVKTLGNLKRVPWLFVLAGAAAALAAVHFSTIEHLYLLSDNRHYTFYVWKNLFRAYPEFKYAAVPVYTIAGLLIFGPDGMLGTYTASPSFSIFLSLCLSLSHTHTHLVSPLSLAAFSRLASLTLVLITSWPTISPQVKSISSWLFYAV